MDWNNITKHPLFLIGAVAVILIAFYYIASPYQNCVRDKNAWFAKTAQESGHEYNSASGRAICGRQNLSW